MKNKKLIGSSWMHIRMWGPLTLSFAARWSGKTVCRASSLAVFVGLSSWDGQVAREKSTSLTSWLVEIWLPLSCELVWEEIWEDIFNGIFRSSTVPGLSVQKRTTDLSQGGKSQSRTGMKLGRRSVVVASMSAFPASSLQHRLYLTQWQSGLVLPFLETFEHSVVLIGVFLSLLLY